MTKTSQSKVDRALRRAMLQMAPKAHYYFRHRGPSRTGIGQCSIHLLSILFLSIFCLTAAAQTVERISQREVARRKAALSHGEEALARGKLAMKEKNFTLAHEEFRTAVNALPDAVVSGKAHDEAVDGFCESGIKLAQQKIAEGKYEEAESILREILTERYKPNCRPAAELLAHLQQPGYFNRTMGPKFIAKVEEVKSLLSDADGYYASGRYDMALK